MCRCRKILNRKCTFMIRESYLNQDHRSSIGKPQSMLNKSNCMVSINYLHYQSNLSSNYIDRSVEVYRYCMKYTCQELLYKSSIQESRVRRRHWNQKSSQPCIYITMNLEFYFLLNCNLCKQWKVGHKLDIWSHKLSIILLHSRNSHLYNCITIHLIFLIMWNRKLGIMYLYLNMLSNENHN